ncbi:phosphonate C-P lyase system protein PhnL [Elioraea sp.]|jgi:alpha-D-ribose 1-methylphosphonate 5-triphosphate synthase subunit PhnL|uniref:phosphonate C-P lyase system protein PhnL n=1 Tax=Elioraea sp. TaxID=2185103 RepID=UPI0021DDBCE6|nr:phosphonate C-P lyase system protein PhnL [Elioraea sp.]GIX09772.1 MAG: phosphonate C-P lyase system protein PhnL [Elioraea sp.]
MSGFALLAEGLSKTFTLHLQGGVRLPVLHEVSLAVRPGECVALTGPSGAGKSTLMRALYGNYLPGGGRILVRHRGALVDLATAGPRGILALRRETIGYVSQFLRVIPRVPARAIVAEPLRAAGMAEAEALAAAELLLARLNLPERLWSLPPATFSGGEQQRVNLARGFAYPYPVMLVDEPTASLDPANAAVAVALIEEAKARGAAIVGIFHDADVRRRVATREHEVVPLAAAA